MNDWAKILGTSSVMAALVSWFAASYKVDQELRSRQIEAGYESLVKANTLAWQSLGLKEEAEREKNSALTDESQQLKRESDALYISARQTITAFGDERVVKALSDYYAMYKGASKPCPDKERFMVDTKIYKAIRETLGVGGNVTDEQIANLMYTCSLK